MSESTYGDEAAGRGSSSRLSILALMGGLLLVYLVIGRPTALPAGWSTDYAAAVSKAATTNRNLLVAFTMKGCPPCTAMDREVLGTRQVRAALSDLVPVHLDVDRDRELANRYEVYGTPTYAVITPGGRVLAKCEGYQPVEQFLRFLSRASQPPAAVGRPEPTVPKASP